MLQRRVETLLGLERAEAELLAGQARDRLGGRGWTLRCAAFAIATAPLLRHAIPLGIRMRAIRPLLHALLPSPSENLYYVLPTARRAVEAAR